MATNISQRFAKTGDFYLLEDTDLRGGLRVVSSLAARDAIPIQARKQGMLVRVVEDGKISMWELPFGKPITNAGWTEASLGGGGDYIPSKGGGLDGVLKVSEFGSMNFNDAVKVAVYDGNMQFTVASELDPDDPEPKGMVTFNDGVKNTVEINLAIGQLVCSTEVGISSDRTLKEDIRRLEGSLEKTRRLCGCTYAKIGQNGRHLGVIAQDVHEVLPEAVGLDSSGKLYVKYGSLAGLFVENILELDVLVQGINNRLDVIEEALSIKREI